MRTTGLLLILALTAMGCTSGNDVKDENIKKPVIQDMEIVVPDSNSKNDSE